MIPSNVQEAYQLAIKARENAHAAYSKFKVGSALKLKHHPDVFIGCNVENASYGATICAERTAITSAIAKYGLCELEFIIVVTEGDSPAYPCGVCRQFMSEFSKGDMPVYIGNTKEIISVIDFKDLLPHAFTEFTV